MKAITWAAIGCGNVCEKKSLPAMYKLAGSHVRGVFARRQSVAEDFATRHNIPHVYPTAEALLADPEVDVVYVATPPSTHIKYTMAALAAGKHVYVEKPMALNCAEAESMHKFAQEQGRYLFVAHYRRALPYFRLIKLLLEQGEIGRVISLDITYLRPVHAADLASDLPWRLQPQVSGGGYFFDLAPHAIDLIPFLLNDTLVKAQGYATNRAGLYEASDSYVGSFATQGGVVGTAQWSFVAAASLRTDSLVITGTMGQIRAAVFAFTPIEVHTSEGVAMHASPPPEHIQMPLIQNILEVLRGQAEPMSASADALQTVWAMQQIAGTS